MASGLSLVVLATGSAHRDEGPGALDPLCGQPLVRHVIDAVADLDVDRVVVVVGRGYDDIAKRLHELSPERGVDCVEQRTARGTGDAVALALTALTDDFADLDDEASVLVVPAGVALLRAGTVGALVRAHRESGSSATLLTVAAPDDDGDVVRGRDDRIVAILGEAPAREFHTGIGVYRRSLLGAAIRRVVPRYSFGESVFGDVIEVLAEAGHRVDSVMVDDPVEVSAAADNAGLARIEAELRRRINRRWLAAGVTMVDPAHTYIDAGVALGRGTHLLPGCTLAGNCVVGAGVRLGPDVHLTDCAVGDGARVRSTTGADAEIGPRADVGPYVVLRPGAQIAADRVTGPFYAAESSAD
ncbi:MAG: NTP transferase domain-containing protein [Acidimicrobiia bacterium]|nr:NTP transferase domain-containing protein [Acidimicrobiia bacterium]